MLARRRALRLNGREVERTPLLVPSFSSKGFPDVRKIIEYSSEIIEGPMLVSAYDLHYKAIEPPFDFASFLFLDSGGYEASKRYLLPMAVAGESRMQAPAEPRCCGVRLYHQAVPSGRISNQ